MLTIGRMICKGCDRPLEHEQSTVAFFGGVTHTSGSPEWICTNARCDLHKARKAEKLRLYEEKVRRRQGGDEEPPAGP